LDVRSEIECGFAVADSDYPDVHIRLGSVPEFLPCSTGQGVLYQCAPGKFLLKVDHVARYLVSHGHEILIQPAEDCDLDAVRLFLSGSVFGALLHQRGLFALHASAVVTPFGAVLFAGLSGSGKSTLACALHRKGYPVLTDEICAIDTRSSPMVLPGYPFLLVWANALEDMGIDDSGLHPARARLGKFILPLGHGFATEPAPLHTIYLLDVVNSGLSAPVPVKGMDKCGALAENTYRPHILEQTTLGSELLPRIVSLARNTRMARVNRPRGSFPIADLVALFEKSFGL
jgi:hypothetical protein